jgi:hypothetical protein
MLAVAKRSFSDEKLISHLTGLVKGLRVMEFAR